MSSRDMLAKSLRIRIYTNISTHTCIYKYVIYIEIACMSM